MFGLGGDHLQFGHALQMKIERFTRMNERLRESFSARDDIGKVLEIHGVSGIAGLITDRKHVFSVFVMHFHAYISLYFTEDDLYSGRLRRNVQ